MSKENHNNMFNFYPSEVCIRFYAFIHGLRGHGHLAANIDPSLSLRMTMW